VNHCRRNHTASEAQRMISIIVPVYRNEKTLRELGERLSQALSGRTYELILVIDASPDGSATLAAQMAESDPRVRVIILQTNVGQNRAILTGLSFATG